MTPKNKSLALEAHICRFNDGAESCECFLAGFNAAQEEQIQIMKEQEVTNRRYLAESKEMYERIEELEAENARMRKALQSLSTWQVSPLNKVAQSLIDEARHALPPPSR